jgi:hypothetical protein
MFLLPYIILVASIILETLKDRKILFLSGNIVFPSGFAKFEPETSVQIPALGLIKTSSKTHWRASQ